MKQFYFEIKYLERYHSNSSHKYVKYTIGHLQPFSQDYGLTSHTTKVVCINFKHEWRPTHYILGYGDVKVKLLNV